MEILGAENVPKDGGTILCSNHQGALDPFLIAATMDRESHFMAKKELFRFKPVGNLFKAAGAFPVDRKHNDVSAIRKAIDLIKSGEMVGIFPQGKRVRGKDPRKTEIKSGVGMMVTRTQCNVLPVYIYTKDRHTRIFHKTVIVIGQVIKYSEFDIFAEDKDKYMEMSRMIFDRICDLGNEYIKEHSKNV